MKDYLQGSRWINRPLANPVQNFYRRFVRQPGAGLPDYLEDSRKKFKGFGNELLKTRFTDMMQENGDHD